MVIPIAISELTRIGESVRNPTGLLKVVGRRGGNELKAHFRSKNRTPNKLGGRRTNWWRGVADSVQNPALEGTSRIRISITEPGIGLQVFGGTVTPKTKEALTLPVDALSHGRTVAVFQQETGIQLFRPRKKGGGLSNLLAGFVGKGPKFTVFYILAKSADVPADPDALPTRSSFSAAILDEATQFLTREIGAAKKS